MKLAGAGAAASLIAMADASAMRRSIPVRSAEPRFKLGLTSYTLREFNLDDTIAMTKRVGLKYICFKSMHLPLDSSPEQITQIVTVHRNFYKKLEMLE